MTALLVLERGLVLFGLLEDRNRVTDADQLFHSRRIPIRRANATMARGPSDRLGIICAVNTDVRLV